MNQQRDHNVVVDGTNRRNFYTLLVAWHGLVRLGIIKAQRPFLGRFSLSLSLFWYDSARNGSHFFIAYLHPGLSEPDSQRQLLPHEDVWIMRLGEAPLQLVELRRREARAVAFLLPILVEVLMLLLLLLVLRCRHARTESASTWKEVTNHTLVSEDTSAQVSHRAPPVRDAPSASEHGGRRGARSRCRSAPGHCHLRRHRGCCCAPAAAADELRAGPGSS